jgi:hypothetical protein
MKNYDWRNNVNKQLGYRLLFNLEFLSRDIAEKNDTVKWQKLSEQCKENIHGGIVTQLIWNL